LSIAQQWYITRKLEKSAQLEEEKRSKGKATRPKGKAAASEENGQSKQIARTAESDAGDGQEIEDAEIIEAKEERPAPAPKQQKPVAKPPAKGRVKTRKDKRR
jgi:YidC/Oxa1 family membrane protein insertase